MARTDVEVKRRVMRRETDENCMVEILVEALCWGGARRDRSR